MIEMHLRAADLAETSFAISPVQEAVFSLWVWRMPDRQPFHLPWRSAHTGAWADLDAEMLDTIVGPRGWVPDFLTPRPSTPLADFEHELDVVRATSPKRVRADIAATYGDDPVPDVLTGRPSAVLRRMCDALDEYWRTCLLPYWPRIYAVLEADIVYRSRQLALGGARGLFGDLDDRVMWDDGNLYLESKAHDDLVHVEINGRGLRLMPSLFCRGAITYVDMSEPPVITYPARGRATVWETVPVETDDTLVALVGAVRAQLLTMLDRPASTTELAHRLGVTPSAVSQHLSVLRAARLLNRARSGRSVLYLRSALVDELVGG